MTNDPWRALAVEAQEAASNAASVAREWAGLGAVNQALAWQTRAALFAKIARARFNMIDSERVLRGIRTPSFYSTL